MSVLVNGEIVLYGFVGETYWDTGFTSREVVDALAEIGRDTDVTVRINSGGGYLDDGIAIYNALAVHKGKVTVIVDAMAASSASIIVMAGEDRIMRKGAMLMIHEPSSAIWGTADDMERFAKVVDKQAENMVGIYADVSGEDVDVIRADMKAELWMNADEAVERGFATAVNSEKAKVTAAHDYRIYAHAPDRLVALSSSKNWLHSEARPKAMASATAATRQREKEKPMGTEPTAAEKTAAENAKAIADASRAAVTAYQTRRKNVLAFEETKGREALAEHLVESDMPEDAIKAALALAPKAETAPPVTTASTYEQRRMSAASLAAPSTSGGNQPASLKVDIVADMKRRHGVK
ncbi:head maturation protease, ClpP-related [Agrobacterium rosae]|uniref:head maturation protease, ClpP-related n=1 Tax=Agrobacterium rosae TaxID=1972867 RepID=UPI001665BF53|nr:head maturation protease, ClpP-related [Agrobacterium rosae]